MLAGIRSWPGVGLAIAGTNERHCISPSCGPSRSGAVLWTADMLSLFLNSLVVIAGLVASVTVAGLLGVVLLATTDSVSGSLQAGWLRPVIRAATQFYWVAVSPSSNSRARLRLVTLMTALIVFAPGVLPSIPLSFDFVL